MLNPTKAELVGPQPYPGRAIIGATLAAGSDSRPPPPFLPTVTSLLLFGLIVWNLVGILISSLST